MLLPEPKVRLAKIKVPMSKNIKRNEEFVERKSTSNSDPIPLARDSDEIKNQSQRFNPTNSITDGITDEDKLEEQNEYKIEQTCSRT